MKKWDNDKIVKSELHPKRKRIEDNEDNLNPDKQLELNSKRKRIKDNLNPDEHLQTITTSKELDKESTFFIPSILPLPLRLTQARNDNGLSFNTESFLPKPTKTRFKFEDGLLQAIDLQPNNMSSPNIPSQFIDTGDDVDGVNGAEKVTSPNGGSYFRKLFYGQAEDDKKKINNELFGYLLYDNFYKTFYNKDILNIRVEDMSQSPKLISKDIENFETLFRINDGDNNLDNVGCNKFASDVVNDIGDKDFNKKLVNIMLLSEIMMFSDLNNSGNIGLKEDRGDTYPVVIDFLTYEETDLFIKSVNNMKYFLELDPKIIKKIINCDNNIDEYTNIPFFYSLLVHNLAKENQDHQFIANQIKNLSKDALNNNFFKDDSEFYKTIKNSAEELRDISSNIRRSNKSNFDINNTKTNIINAITMFFDINKKELQKNNINFVGCVEKIENMVNDVKSESSQHTNKIIDRRLQKPINAWCKTSIY